MGNQGFLELSLIDVRGNEVADPKTRIEISHASGPLIGRVTHAFPPLFRGVVPAFPQSQVLSVEIDPSLYRRRSGGFFSITHNETVRRRLTVLRHPKKWRPEFELWNDLTPLFDPFKELLGKSRNIWVRGGPVIEDFTGATYDSADSAVVVNAKAGLLNLFAKLSEEKDPTHPDRNWFSYVEEIEEIRKDRFIARVESEMGASVRKIRDHLDAFPNYERTAAGNHHGNLKRFGVKKSGMFSVKTGDDHGNLQLTFGEGVDGDGASALYLDTDIDENGRLFNHLIDAFFVHRFTRGTRPMDIHEYLALAYPERELGYRPVGA